MPSLITAASNLIARSQHIAENKASAENPEPNKHRILPRREFCWTAAGALTACVIPAFAATPLSLFNGASLDGWIQLEKTPSTPPVAGWIVKDGAMASTGSGRGVIYTAQDYSRFRLMFTMRHVSGNPDHQACVLIFCTRPVPGEKPLDALAGIQFQVPNGGHWDYRPGMNNNGGAEFTSINKTHFEIHEWSRVEIVANASTGVARMAVAQPPGSKAVEVLNFKDPAAGKAGPIAWQMHNAGLFDEFKDVTIEPNPADDGLVSLR